MSTPTIAELLREFDRAVGYSHELAVDLTDSELAWRPDEHSSAIGWHLGHQAAVTHYLVRNLTAAEPSVDPHLDRLMDSATQEPDRGDLPARDVLLGYRNEIADRLRFHVGRIDRGEVGAPTQLRRIAHGLVTAVVNHEYQHDQWVGEVRTDWLGKDLPPRPTSDLLVELDGYLILG